MFDPRHAPLADLCGVSRLCPVMQVCFLGGEGPADRESGFVFVSDQLIHTGCSLTCRSVLVGENFQECFFLLL